MEDGVRDVVLLHGWGADGSVWKDMAERLAARHRPHAPELPGYGAHSAGSADSLEQIAVVMARAAPSRCHVVGWSLGGQVALAWARREPRQVERLALIATTPCFARRPDWPHAVAPELLAEFRSAVGSDKDGALQRFVSLQAKGDENARLVLRRLRDGLVAGGETARPALERGLQILLEGDLRESLGAIRQPTLVIHGDRDAVVPLAAGEYLSRRLPAARLLALRGAAHAPFLSDPTGVAAALEAFFLDSDPI